MQKNFKLTIEYDGTNYHGWQRQKNKPTIQGEIEKAIKVMTGTTVNVSGSGRTDAGVHAKGQVANFHCDTSLKPNELHSGLNSLLADDIVIKTCEQVDASFHARYDAKSKLYHYTLFNRPLPKAIGRQYVWFIRKKLNLDAMRSCIAHIMGRHDFVSFEGVGSPRQHTNRHVYNAELAELEKGVLIFRIEADGFLRFMVRNLVGTLVDVGLEKLTAHDFKHIMDSKDRARASATAPPQGLCLIEVKY
jgi:tRNA pseudouridine38-40 synthase